MEFKSKCQYNIHHIFVWSFLSVPSNKFFQGQFLSILVKIFADVDCKGIFFVVAFLVWVFWYHSSEHTLLPSLVIFNFEIPEMLQEEVIVSGPIPLPLWIGKPLTSLALLRVTNTYPVREMQKPQPCSAFSETQTSSFASVELYRISVWLSLPSTLRWLPAFQEDKVNDSSQLAGWAITNGMCDSLLKIALCRVFAINQSSLLLTTVSKC